MLHVAFVLCAALGLGTDVPPHAQLNADRSALRAPIRGAAGTVSVCPDESNDCQLPDQQGHGAGGTLAASVTGFIVADDFNPTSDGIINAVCWWGAYFDFGANSDCGPGTAPDNWQITYYESEFSGPGRIIAGPFPIGEADAKAPTGEQITNGTATLDVYGYRATHPDVVVSNSSCYWIEITNLADDGSCDALWTTAPPGNGLSYQSNSGQYDNRDVQDYDLAWCINGPTVEAASCTIDEHVDCSPDAILENEPACADDYVDVTNGGCDAAPGNAAWLPTAFGNSYCGDTGGFRFTAASCTDDRDCPGSTCVDDTCTGPIDARDSDWWDVTVTEQTFVRVEIAVGFSGLVGFVDDQDHTCTAPQFLDQAAASAFVGPFQQAGVEACLEPGSWSFFVAPSSYGPTAARCGPSSTYDFFLDLGDAGAGPGVCPTAQTVCLIEDGLQCQFPDQMGHGSSEIIAATSDSTAGFQVADSLQSVAGGSITELCWWGYYIDFADGNSDCGPGQVSDDFVIRYYEDDSGQPGALITEFSQADGDLGDFVKAATGLETGGFSEYGFTAEHAPVATSPGQCLWVSVQGRGSDEQCFFLWGTAPPGDARGWQSGAPEPQLDYDFAWCMDIFVTPDGCHISGACCDDAAQTCTDDVVPEACTGRFAPSMTCARLDPPCGSGACCDGVCTTVEDSAECSGEFTPGVFCAQDGGTLICNAGCAWDNGPGTAPVTAVAAQYAANEFVAAGADNFDFEFDGCSIIDIQWFAAHFNFQGRCSTQAPCTVGDPTGCNGHPGDCTPGVYAGDPSDYTAIDIVVYTDAAETGSSGPAGKPVTAPIACTIDQDCSDANAPACTCVAGQCVFDPGGADLVCDGPTGAYDGVETQVCTVDGGWSYEAYVRDGQPVEDAWRVYIPTFSCAFDFEVERTYYLSVVPHLPFLPPDEAYYQVGWMTSENADGRASHSIFPALSEPDWSPDEDARDLAFDFGNEPPMDCLVQATGCGDSNDDGIRDDPCAFYECSDFVCTAVAKNTPSDMGGQFGSCIIDGAADGNDRFLSLSCFGDQWPDTPCEVDPPMAINVDAGSAFGACALDGICDGHDAFAALNSFAGVNTCDALCAPAPVGPAHGPTFDTAERTGLNLTASTRRVAPGRTVAIDVALAEPLKDLRGYQLHLGVDGGTAGALELVDIAIEPRRDATYADRPDAWQAFNRSTGQMVAGLDTAGIAVPGGAYLATFTYRATRDARGRFAISVLADDRDATQRTFLFPTRANGRIAIRRSRDIVIEIE